MSRLGLTIYGCEPDEAALFDELCPRFAIVPTITSDAASPASATAASGNRCVSVGHKSAVARPTLLALRAAGVEHISTRSVGVDHIDLRAAACLGIAVENVAYAPDGVADYTLMLILMAIRNAKEVLGLAQRRDFRLSTVRGRDLSEMTVGVLGVGKIGGAVVSRLRGFGCRVLACGTRRDAAVAADFVSLDELLRESDVVTLHLPLDIRTRHLIGREQLATMKHGAFLVNTGRGALVDTEALLASLEGGRLAGAALDVVEGEEGLFYVDCTDRPADDHLLWRLQHHPNVIVTPHTAYYTDRALRETVERTLVSCSRYGRRSDGTNEDCDPVRRVLGGA